MLAVDGGNKLGVPFKMREHQVCEWYRPGSSSAGTGRSAYRKTLLSAAVFGIVFRYSCFLKQGPLRTEALRRTNLLNWFDGHVKTLNVLENIYHRKTETWHSSWIYGHREHSLQLYCGRIQAFTLSSHIGEAIRGHDIYIHEGEEHALCAHVVSRFTTPSTVPSAASPNMPAPPFESCIFSEARSFFIVWYIFFAINWLFSGFLF